MEWMLNGGKCRLLFSPNVSVRICLHACMHDFVCTLHTCVSESQWWKKNLQGKNKSLSFWQLSFSFPTIYSSTHASCSPGNDWLFGLVSQLHAYMFSSLPSLSFSLFQACTASHSSTPWSLALLPFKLFDWRGTEEKNYHLYHSFPNPLQLADGHFQLCYYAGTEKTMLSGLRAIQMQPVYIFALQLFDDPRQHGQCLKKTN